MPETPDADRPADKRSKRYRVDLDLEDALRRMFAAGEMPEDAEVPEDFAVVSDDGEGDASEA